MNLYRVVATEDLDHDRKYYYECEVVSSSEDKAQIIAMQELPNKGVITSCSSNLDWEVTEWGEAENEPRFKLKSESNYGGERTCYGCHNVTRIGEKDQCDC